MQQFFASSRTTAITALFPDAPSYRRTQITAALFDDRLTRWHDVTTLPHPMRTQLEDQIPWVLWTDAVVLTSRTGDTHKALLTLTDGSRIETVLMRNARGQWTVCVSSQVGCAMKCTFCATGTMGFTRNLTEDEIIDQYRFWRIHQRAHATDPHARTRISNIVFMGMGEPLANYDNVRGAITTILAHTDIGLTRISVSTVGMIPMLHKITRDPLWPHVRLAVSLHSADEKTRKAMMPTSYDGFLDALAAWAKDYFTHHETRRNYVTFEYVMLSGVNDTLHHATALVAFACRIGKVRINLIPYNTTHSGYSGTADAERTAFQQTLMDAGLTVTQRRTMGDDIAAACGQLVVKSRTE